MDGVRAVTGWTECAPLLVREQGLLTEVLSELRKLMPFALLGFDTDNEGAFMNETVRDYCKGAGIEFTRCRLYRKNEQAWVEQKNGTVPRSGMSWALRGTGRGGGASVQTLVAVQADAVRAIAELATARMRDQERLPIRGSGPPDYHWPGPLHEGNGSLLPIVDEILHRSASA